MATQLGDKVKLETMISMESIPWNTRSEDFSVLVQVTVPPAISTEQENAGARGVDLVAVLEISGSMNEDDGLKRMKDAMISVIDQLRPEDRLSILSFNDEVQTLMELCQMSDENWARARKKVEELAAPTGGGANVKAATDAASTILAQREQEEQSNRVGRVIFLSSDDDNADAEENKNTSPPGGQNTNTRGPEFAPDAFILGADGNLSALSLSANNTSGVYSYVQEDVDKIKDAPGLTSVDTALSIQIDLHAQDGVSISSIESGNHRVSVGPDGPRSLTIYIQDLYPGEKKNLTVYLAVPEGKKELLAVTGWYREPENGEDIQLDVSQVYVPRPKNILDMVKITWAWGRNNPYYSCAFTVLLLLGVAMILMPKKGDHNGKMSSSLDILQHPGWSKMEESLDMIVPKEMDDARITSFFDDASLEDMSDSMNRYIYQALVHGTGVSMLEQTAKMLEAENQDLQVKIKTLAEEDQGGEGDGEGCRMQGEERGGGGQGQAELQPECSYVGGQGQGDGS